MKALPANRVVLILGVIVTVAGAAATYVAGVTKSLPASWQANATIIVTVLGGIAGVITAVVKFLDGSQKFDALQAQARVQTASARPMTASAPAPQPAPQLPADPAPEPTDVDQDRVDDGHWRPASALEPEAPAPGEEEAKPA